MKFVLLFLLLVHYSECYHECSHPIINITSTSVHQADSQHVRMKRSPQNIRISRYYDSTYTSMPNSATITQNILDPAIQFWQNSLAVNNPLSSPLIVDRACTDSYSYKTVGGNRIKICDNSCSTQQLCYNTPIPSQYLQSCYVQSSNAAGYTTSESTGAGATNTDLLVIVTQVSNGCAANTLAYAVACELEYTLDRPVVGLINICPGKINIGVGQNMAVSTLKHEITHILGMSSNLFAFWRTPAGVPLTPRDNSGLPNLGLKNLGTASIYQYSNNTVKDFVKTFNYVTGPIPVTVSYIVTPTVKQEIQNYFGCPTLEGMMLEGYGSPSSALSHFEKLYLQNELMTASIAVNSLASRLTFAVLQDTGWYTPNFNNAENFTYAKNLGCNFLSSSCYDYINAAQTSGQTLLPYCNQPVTVGGLTCTPDMTQQQFCSLYDNSVQAAQIPPQFKYFPNTNWVSPDAYSDYCPVIGIYLFVVNSYSNTGQCLDPLNNEISGTVYDYFNQRFGANSICVPFDRTTPWYVASCGVNSIPSIQGAGCYQYQCLPNYGLVIVVNNFQYQCSSANQIIDVTSKNIAQIPHGKLVCPSCQSVCSIAICNSVNANLAVQCNNVDRPCPGQAPATIPCSSSILRIQLTTQVTIAIIYLLSQM